MTELMKTFTMASVLPCPALPVLPPRVEPPSLRPGVIQMTLAGASERHVQPGAEPKRQLLHSLFIGPLVQIFQQQHLRLDRGRLAKQARRTWLRPARAEVAKDRPGRVRYREDRAEGTGDLEPFGYPPLEVKRCPSPADALLQEEHASRELAYSQSRPPSAPRKKSTPPCQCTAAKLCHRPPSPAV